MEESTVYSTETAENSHSDHGWRKVVNPKRQRKPNSKDSIRTNGTGDKAGNVFRNVEQHAEERRRRAIEAQKAALDAADFLAKPSPAEDSTSDEDGEVKNLHPNGEEKKPKEKKPKKPKVTVAEAAAKIDAADLSAFLADVSGSYENAPDIQLMRFADYYARAFSAVTASQFPWTKIFKESPVQKIIEIPVNSISEDVYKTSIEWIGYRPTEALSEFVSWAFDCILVDLVAHQGTAKGSKKTAQPPPSKAQEWQGTSKEICVYRLSNAVSKLQLRTQERTIDNATVAIFLALAMVLRRRPESLFNLMPTLKSGSKYQGQDRLPVLIWAIGQACQGDLAVGMSLWVQILLPLAVGKSSNPQSRDLVLQLLERILSSPKARPVLLNGAVKKGERLVPPSALDLLMQVTFPIPSNRIKATERFEAAYPFLKELALAGTPGSKAMKQVAAQLLSVSLSAISKSNPELSQEAAGTFIWCLSQSAESFKHWEKVYTDQIEASTVVLAKLVEGWKELSSKFYPYDNLRQTLKSLQFKNEKALNGDEQDPNCLASFKLADKLCKVLLAKLTRRGGCLKTGVVILAVGVAAYAVASSNSDVWEDLKKLSVSFISDKFI